MIADKLAALREAATAQARRNTVRWEGDDAWLDLQQALTEAAPALEALVRAAEERHHSVDPIYCLCGFAHCSVRDALAELGKALA